MRCVIVKNENYNPDIYQIPKKIGKFLNFFVIYVGF